MVIDRGLFLTSNSFRSRLIVAQKKVFGRFKAGEKLHISN